jgi:hypothetical protein
MPLHIPTMICTYVIKSACKQPEDAAAHEGVKRSWSCGGESGDATNQSEDAAQIRNRCRQKRHLGSWGARQVRYACIWRLQYEVLQTLLARSGTVQLSRFPKWALTSGIVCAPIHGKSILNFLERSGPIVALLLFHHEQTSRNRPASGRVIAITRIVGTSLWYT